MEKQAMFWQWGTTKFYLVNPTEDDKEKGREILDFIKTNLGLKLKCNMIFEETAVLSLGSSFSTAKYTPITIMHREDERDQVEGVLASITFHWGDMVGPIIFQRGEGHAVFADTTSDQGDVAKPFENDGNAIN